MNIKDFETTPEGGFLVTFTEVKQYDFTNGTNVIVWPTYLVEIPKAVTAVAQFFSKAKVVNTDFFINQDAVVAVYETSQAGPEVSGTSCLLLNKGWTVPPPRSGTAVSIEQLVANLTGSKSAFLSYSGMKVDIGIRMSIEFSELNSGIGIPFIKVPKKEAQLAQAFNHIQAVQQHNIIKAMCTPKETIPEEEDEPSFVFKMKNSSKKKNHH
jgi:hypothetical protein